MIRSNVDLIDDLEICEGARYHQPFVWTSGETAETQVEVDLTGYTAAMQVRAKITDSAPLLSLTDTDGLVIPDQVATPGRYEIDIPCADLEGICVTHKDIKGVYDLFLYDPQGVCRAHQYGAATIRAAVTRTWEV